MPSVDGWGDNQPNDGSGGGGGGGPDGEDWSNADFQNGDGGGYGVPNWKGSPDNPVPGSGLITGPGPASRRAAQFCRSGDHSRVAVARREVVMARKPRGSTVTCQVTRRASSTPSFMALWQVLEGAQSRTWIFGHHPACTCEKGVACTIRLGSGGSCHFPKLSPQRIELGRRGSPVPALFGRISCQGAAF